jgi:outer membrane protein TolC
MKILLKFLFPLLLTASGALAQEENPVTILTYNDYISIVRQHHPIAKVADLQPQEGRAVVQSARGVFDPVAFSQAAQKYFNGKQYYSLINSGLRMPTWFGAELRAGLEQNEGIFLNPERNVPAAGLYYAGISVPIGQGLFVDKRRADLRRAQIFQKISDLEQKLILNDLIYDAGKAYWDWFFSYHTMQTFIEAYDLANERFLAVRIGALLGDRPAIDTLEAGIQLQNRSLDLQQSELEFANTTALLSVYLWSDGLIPLETAPGTIPMPMEGITAIPAEPELLSQFDNLLAQHPDLQQSRFKIDRMEVERRWRREQLKPVLNLRYNALSEPIGNNPLAEYTSSNYTWGFEFAMPLFLRRERGDLRLINVMLQEAEYEITSKQAGVAYKATAALNEWNTTNNQINLYTGTVRDYRGMLDGERSLFEAGESSIFMVNLRETQFIQAQVKLIELISKNRKASLNTRFALGLLWE